MTYKNIRLAVACVIGAVLNYSAYADSGLSAYLQQARVSCSGISAKMTDMKKKAGISTALTGVGTVAGGAALGAGLMKSKVDASVESLEQELKKLVDESEQLNKSFEKMTSGDKLMQFCLEEDANALKSTIDANKQKQASVQSNIDTMTGKSKTLGNVRTGGLAGAAITDAAGSVLAFKNRVDMNVQDQIAECSAAIGGLEQSWQRARAEGTATEQELMAATKIIDACSEWNNVDLSKIDKRATGAAISGGAGAALALFGTITSASANSNAVRNSDNSSKEKNLNTASNILAGGTGVASLTSTVFNATQISAIKKAAAVADKCEEALR